MAVQSQMASLHTDASHASLVVGTARGLWFMEAQRLELEGQAITAIASGTDGLWAIVNHNSVWQRNGDWRQIASVPDLRLTCLLPLDDMVLVGTADARLLRIAQGTVEFVDRFTDAEGRDDWYTPWGGPPAVRSMAEEADDWYVNVHVGGILRSGDRGQSWQPTIDLHADVHQVQTIPGMIVAATAQGLALSRDHGISWQFDRTHLHAAYARAVAVCDDTILMSASVGPSGGKSALYRRALDRSGFEKCQQGLPQWFSHNIDTGCLAATQNVVAFGTDQGQVFASSDKGLTWETIVSGLAPVHCLIAL